MRSSGHGLVVIYSIDAVSRVGWEADGNAQQQHWAILMHRLPLLPMRDDNDVRNDLVVLSVEVIYDPPCDFMEHLFVERRTMRNFVGCCIFILRDTHHGHSFVFFLDDHARL